MRFILNGFTQEMGFRVFAFEKVGDDHSRTAYTVKADLALSRRYDIRMQELPLLCRVLLERREQADESRTFTFTEEEMSLYAKECAVTRRVPAFKKRPPVEGAASASQGTRP